MIRTLYLALWLCFVYLLVRMTAAWGAREWELAGTVLMWAALTGAGIAIVAACEVLRDRRRE